MRCRAKKMTGTGVAAIGLLLAGAGVVQAQTTTPTPPQGVNGVLAKAAAMRGEAEARAYYGGAAVRTGYSAAAGSLQRLQTLLGAGGYYALDAAPAATRAEAQQDVLTLWEAAKGTKNPRRASELRRAAQLYASAATRYFRAEDREGRVPPPPQGAAQVAGVDGTGAVPDATTDNTAYPPQPVYGYPQFYPYSQTVTTYPALNGPQIFNYGPQFGAQVITIGPQGYGGFLPGFRFGLF